MYDYHTGLLPVMLFEIYMSGRYLKCRLDYRQIFNISRTLICNRIILVYETVAFKDIELYNGQLRKYA